MNPLKSLRQRYVELSEPYRLLLQLKAVTGGFSRSLLPECLREAGVQPPRGQVWNAGDIRTALHTLRQMGLTDDKDRVVAEFEHDLCIEGLQRMAPAVRKVLERGAGIHTAALRLRLAVYERDLKAYERARLDAQAMEEGGSITYWQVIFEANSFTDLLDRLNMMQEISEADQRRLQEMRIASDIVTATRMSLESEKTELEGTWEELTAAEAELEEKRTESDDMLRELEKKSEEYQQLMDESEALQDELMQEIAAKEKDLKQAKYDEYLAKLALQGENPPSNASWTTPVSGYTITSPFGIRTHPILGTQRMHNGIDMACNQGTPIYATRAGTVTVASYQAGGAGYYVSINHLDGFSSIYMHMTNYVVSAGQSVSQGQLIGYVGSTGLSTGPHLHFGISYAGTYVNPLAYIY